MLTKNMHKESQIKSNQIIYLVKQVQRHWQNE